MNDQKPNQQPPTIVPCPTCGKPVAWVSMSKWRPFCSDRCRLIDLGEWLSENHRIPEQSDESSNGI